jgi:YhhN family
MYGRRLGNNQNLKYFKHYLINKKLILIFEKSKIKMENKLFKVCAFISLLCLISLSIIYDFFGFKTTNLKLKIVLKASPMIVLLLLNVSYFLIYRLTVYSIFMFSFLLFCLIGDILLATYEPVFIDFQNPKITYFILGGAFFFLSRLLLFIIFSIKPYKRIIIIRYPIKKMIISHIIFETPFLILGILILVHQISLISVFIFIYLILGFGFPWSAAFLRIGELNNYDIVETKISSIFAFIGVTLFNISDIMLLLGMSNQIPTICVLISDSIYWTAMYFLVISIVRSPSEHIEKGLEYFPPYLTINSPKITEF